MTRPPALVVTDSQAFLKVAADVPRSVPMTSFSILMSRFQGDLAEQVRGTVGIERLKGGDRVLMAETCTHHPVGEDIGRVKIPRWLTQYVGAKLEFTHVQGRDFPADLSPYRLVVHCGNCTGNRREMLSRIHRCREAGRAHHQLRPHHRLLPGHLRAGAGPLPGGAGGVRAGPGRGRHLTLTAASVVPPVVPCGRLRVPGPCADPPARDPLGPSSLRSGGAKRSRCSFPPGPSRFVFVSMNKNQKPSWDPGHSREPPPRPMPPTEGTPTPGGEGPRETLAHAQEAKPTSMRQGSHAPLDEALRAEGISSQLCPSAWRKRLKEGPLGCGDAGTPPDNQGGLHESLERPHGT